MALSLALTTALSGGVAWLTFGAQSAEQDWGLGRTLTSGGLSMMTWIIAWIACQWTLSSRHRMLARMAQQNLGRRKRNTALVIVGLLVGSAIVSSSLVIGDSLDATMEEQFLAPLGDTDYYIRGHDPLTGVWTTWNQTRTEALFDELHGWEEVEGVRGGLVTTSSVLHDGLGEPMVEWYAFDAVQSSAGGFAPIGGGGGVRYADIPADGAVINSELAESIDAEVGDSLEVHWMEVDLQEGITRDSTNLTVFAVVGDVNTGHRNARSPLIFTRLDAAQSIRNEPRTVSHLAIAVEGDGTEALRWRIGDAVNATLLAEDAGFTIQAEPASGMIAVARTTGLGLLDVDEIANLSAAVDELDLAILEARLLQVPLYNIAERWVNVSGLASTSISTIAQSPEWDWYGTSQGLSLQAADGQWWIYQPEDIEDIAIRDVELVGENHGFVAHAAGLRELNLTEGAPDADHLEGREIQALDRLGDTLLALEENDGVVHLHHAGPDLEWDTATLDAGLDAMAVDLAVANGTIHVRVEGLFGTATCVGADASSLICEDDPTDRRSLFSHGDAAWVSVGPTLSLLEGNTTTPAWMLGLPNGTLHAHDESILWVEDAGFWAWNGSGFEAHSMTVPSVATEDDAILDLTADRLIISTGDGVSILEDGNQTGRLPSTIKVDVMNRLPLMVVALEGGEMLGFDAVPEGMINVSSWAAETLALESGEAVRLRGYLPTARGQLEGERLVADSVELDLPAPPGQDAFAAVTFGLVSVSDAEALAGGSEGDRTLVLLSGPGLAPPDDFAAVEAQLADWADEQADVKSADLDVRPIKANLVEGTAEVGESFSMLFLIFGSFVIFAGVLLVMNIFVMLADERKPEMGMARAIGMQRSDLRSLFVQEGVLLGLLSSAAGAVAGIGVAWALMGIMGIAFRDTMGWEVVFAWRLESLLAGFATGFLVTWSTLWCTSMWISRLNVVAAIRSIPTRYGGGLPWWSILITLFLSMSSAASLGLAFVTGDADDGSRHAWWTLGVFIGMLALVPPAFWVAGKLLPEDLRIGRLRLHRPVVVPRLILTVLSLSMILFGWKGDPISAEWEQGAFSFIVLGLFMVAAGVMLLTSLAPLVARAAARLLAPVSRRVASVLPTSLSYPLATPFRTAMTMGMFSLVVFAVVVLSGYSALFGNYIAEMGEEAGGEFEIIAVGSEIDGDLSNWDLGEASWDAFDGVAVLSAAAIHAERGDGDGERLTVAARGFDANFTDRGALALDLWAEELGTEEEAWQAVLEDESLVIIDYSLSPQPPGLEGNPTLDLVIGSELLISDPFNAGVNRTVFVAGILKQESSIMAPGVYMSHAFAEQRFEAEPQMVWFSLPEGTSVAAQQSIADEIERGMAEEGVAVIVIEVAFAKMQTFFLSMFNLLQAFLGLGLAVGIAGLAVVTVRNVSERRHQIGILRAIGFQRGMVVAGFLVELSWISFLGIFNGALVGIGFHYALYERFLAEDGAPFLLPWMEIWTIVIGAYVLTLLATVWPVRTAATIRPAEALRDVD